MENSVKSHQDEMPIVTIIILNYNSYNETTKCIHSLENIEYSNFNIIIVDNGSHDGSGKKLEKEFSEYDVILNEENLGFAAGVNVGIRTALEQGTEYVLLLNNDTIVQPSFLKPLVNVVEQRDRVGMVGSVVKFADSGDIQSAGRSLNFSRVQSPHWREIKQSEPYETKGVSGACVLISTEFLNEQGLLDESYFFYVEDVELCLRARFNDWKIFVQPKSIVYHAGSSTASSLKFTWYHRVFGRYQLSSDYHSCYQRLHFILFMSYLLSKHYISWIMSGRIDLIKVTLSAIFDHITGNKREIRPN